MQTLGLTCLIVEVHANHKKGESVPDHNILIHLNAMKNPLKERLTQVFIKVKK